MKHLRLLLLFFMTALFSGNALAEGETAKAVWDEANTTLSFVYDNETYPTESSWVLTTGFTESGSFEDEDDLPWKDIVRSITKVVFQESFAAVKPTSTACLFSYMNALTSIVDIKYLNTSEVTNMSNMFSFCNKLTSIDLSNFNTSKVKNMYSMFASCMQLNSLDLSRFDTSNVEDMGDMFYYCMGLTSLDLSSFNTSNVWNMNGMFGSCQYLQTLKLGDNFDTSKVWSMEMMFYACANLTSLNLGDKFDTSKVTNMSQMFSSCSALTSLDLGDKFDTSKVTDMSQMFYACQALTSLDLGDKFDTSKVTNMLAMFNRCNALATLDLGDKFDTSKVINMEGMFYNCYALATLNLGDKFDTSSVTTMLGMFWKCQALTTLDLGDKFDTSKVTNMQGMFYECNALATLDLGDKFDTSKVTTMQAMFQGTAFTELDLTSFDISNVTTVTQMFAKCYKLKTIYCDEDADWSTINTGDNIFYGCSNLIGKCGTKEFTLSPSSNFTTAANVGKKYAKVCTPDQEGFFTPKHTVKLNASGYATYASSKIPVEFKEADSYTAWKITAIDGENITFEQITGAVPAGTGVLLMGDANGSAEINFYGTAASALSGNLLEGVTTAKEIAAAQYYGLSGNEFVKVSAGTVPAHKALLPANNVSVKSLNLVFNDETGIREVRTVSGEQAAEIFNLAGQRLQKTQKGVNIINGKKVLVK